RPPSVTSAPPQFGYGSGISHTVSPVRKLNFLNLPVIPGFSGYMYTLANTYTVPCCVCERSWGSSSMHQLLVGQYAMPGSVGSIAHGCWSLPPMADGQAWVLPPGANGECSFTLTGRPVFMSTFSAQFVVTYLVARSSVPSPRSSTYAKPLRSKCTRDLCILPSTSMSTSTTSLTPS